LTESARELVGGTLLRLMDETFYVRIDGTSFDEQMNVVRHEAVGENFNAFLGCGTQNFTPDEIDASGVRKEPKAITGAKR
jgi:hypothetical protein